MQRIIPFKKELVFKTDASEITSISLEHSLREENNTIRGEFYISGQYKMTDLGVNIDPFNFEIPFDINFDDRYDLSKSSIDIDNFYYELVDNKKLLVNIDVLVDNIGENEVVEEIKEEIREEKKEEIREEKKEEVKNKVIEEEKEERVENVKSLFDSMDESDEVYSSYKVYILKESDTIETVISKYNITKEQLGDYNELTDIKIGDKLIIPTNERS